MRHISFRAALALPLLLSCLFAPMLGVLAATSKDEVTGLVMTDKGDLWYVSPVNRKRYALSTPKDALAKMRSLAVKLSATALNAAKTDAQRQAYAKTLLMSYAGRLLSFTGHGSKVFYLDPKTKRLYFFDGSDASWKFLRSLAVPLSGKSAGSAAAPVAVRTTQGKVDCKEDFDCYIQAVKAKREAVVQFYSQLEFKEAGGQYMFKMLKGYVQECTFTDLDAFIAVLYRWKDGKFSSQDMDFAKCTISGP